MYDGEVVKIKTKMQGGANTQVFFAIDGESVWIDPKKNFFRRR
jgi:hypothetical protein